jgi:class 3 adenylate cyclase
MVQDGAPVDGAPPLATRATRRRRGFGSIQTKLLAMLLLTSILSSLVIGFFGYRSGTSSLRDAAYARLADVRSERTLQLQQFADSVQDAVLLDSQGVGVDASKQFNQGFTALADAPVTDADRAALDTYYADVFGPRLQKNVGGDIDPAAFVPSLPARSYLQAHYTVPFDDFDAAAAVDDAGDGSAWSAANARFNPYFRDVATRLGLDDVLLLDRDGNVVYSVYKGTDLGSNVVRGELSGGALEQVYDEAAQSNNRDFVSVADFTQYQPSYGAPTMFLASPVGTADDLTGVLVYEVSTDQVNAVMTGGADLSKVEGLGDTGETYVAAGDGTMRSNSRLLIEDPKQFASEAKDEGVPAEDVDRMVRTGSSVLLMPTTSDAVQRGLRGESGTARVTSYLGEDVLDSYAPAGIQGLDWVVISKIDADEALAPVDDFARNLLLTTAAVILLICAASVLMARIFTDPVQRLLTGVRAVAGGALGTQVDDGSRDEFGDLGTAFNDLSASLRSKQELLDAQLAENDRILRSLMPQELADRYRGGETQISLDHRDVSVVYTEISGFDAFAADRSAEESLSLLAELSRGFDAAATTAGIERVRSVGTGYVGSSGLVVRRVDHARRVVDFSVDVAKMVERFNSTYGARLALRAGVHTGAVRSGLVTGDMVYNLWGEAVDLAYRVRTVAGGPGIYLTDDVRQRLGTAYRFEEAGTLAGDTPTPVWRVVTESS